MKKRKLSKHDTQRSRDELRDASTRSDQTSSSTRPLLAGIARHALTLIVTVAISVAGTVAYNWYDRSHGPLGPFSLVGWNYTDRPIYTFSVNGKWGGNVFAKSGGGATCCTDIARGEPVRIKWQIDRLDKEEIYERELPPLDPPPRGNTYLQVHFLPNQEVRIHASDIVQDALPGYGLIRGEEVK